MNAQETYEDRRDFFAANAPSQIPTWFEVENSLYPEETEPPRQIDGAPEEVNQTIADWLDDPCYDLGDTHRAFHRAFVDELSALQDQWIAYWTAKNLTEKEQVKKRVEVRFFAWRWYYATKMADLYGLSI